VGSINVQRFGLAQAAQRSPRIGVGKVLEVGSFRYPGSSEVVAQSEGQSLGFHRVEVLRVLKGEGLAPGQELRIFSPAPWFQHTHAAALRGGVISYSDSRYSGGLDASRIIPGTEILFYLGEEPSPAGFPPGAAFLAMDGALDRADREEALLKEGPYGSFNRRIVLQVDGRVRLPDGLEIRLGPSSHKRPMTGGPTCESTHLTLSKDETSGHLQLNHVTDPDGSQSWDKGVWSPYTVELLGMKDDASAEVVVRQA
jgi:hypothetical protein